MTKLLVILLCLSITNAQAMFVGVHDGSSQNRFLGLDFHSCGISSGYEAYKCGNGSVTGLLHLNLFSLQNYGKQFYLFNDFFKIKFFSKIHKRRIKGCKWP